MENKHKHKKHDKYRDNKEVLKNKKLERIASDMIKEQEKNEKLKQFNISTDIFKEFEDESKTT